MLSLFRQLQCAWVNTGLNLEGRLKRNPAFTAQVTLYEGNRVGFFCPTVYMSSVNQFCIVFVLDCLFTSYVKTFCKQLHICQCKHFTEKLNRGRFISMFWNGNRASLPTY